ncbi:MAG TPA: cellulose binding domain-containing protein [Pseudonocardiaceae bacterium]|nr:cellulose binding domain-containing protein [Pseudonocardiaceae bacterium]
MNISFRRFGRPRGGVRLLGAAALGIGALVAAAPGIAHAAAPTVVTYVMNANWGSGFQADVTITPGTGVTSWSLEFDAGDQQQITLAAYAGATQAGRHVTLTNRSFNGTIAAGASENLVVQFTNPTLTDAPPPAFTFNGVPAAYTPQPYLQTTDAQPIVPEGGSATVGLTLSQAPTSTVTVRVGSGSSAAVVAAPQSLTFTAADWNVPHPITLTSPRDTDTTNETSWISLEQWGGSPTYTYDFILATELHNG